MISWEEPEVIYGKSDSFPLKDETFEIIGICMEVHRILGKGLLEIVYKDAVEHELKLRKLKFEREKKYEIEYKGIVLPHFFVADFVINNIVVEIKAQNGISADQFAQVINYVTISRSKVGLLINFGESSLKFKRFIV
jgi:GxxExxY protein